MQLFLNQFRIQEYLLFSLIAVAATVLAANFFSQQTATEITNWSFVLLSGAVMMLSVCLVSKYGTKGNHGKAWILFALFSTYWFVAELLWVLYDVVFQIPAWEYADDFFYITGYQLFFAFMIFYLRPFKRELSKKLVAGISLLSLILLLPSIYMIASSEFDILENNLVVAATYPILDAIILVPAAIGVILFFKGEVHFMLSLICLGIVTQIVGDYSLLFASASGTYYAGHPGDILFLWTYLMFAFGIGKQIGLFSISDEQEICPACGKSCNKKH